MSERNPRKRAPARAGQRRDQRAEPRAFYVYAIGESAELTPLLEGGRPSAIEEAAPVELLARGALAAVVSSVPLSVYGEEALPSRLADATWMATRAMRHEAVVEHFARRASVIPLRFGAIYLKRERVLELLAGGEAEFRRRLERLRGREE